MLNAFSRTQLIYGRQGMARLAASRVLVFGLGGVGGHAVEALARSGVGTLDLVDDDRICLTNLNRQLLATRDTVGRLKVEVARERIAAINPDAAVNLHACFYLPETADQFDFTRYGYIIDAVDTVKAKLEIAMRAHAAGVPVISVLGAGNKTDASRLRVADLYQTSVCPLARIMRAELRKRGLASLQVVFSDEPPLRPAADDTPPCRTQCVCPPSVARKCTQRREIPGSNAFVPAVAGMLAAGEVVNHLAGELDEGRRKGE